MSFAIADQLELPPTAASERPLSRDNASGAWPASWNAGHGWATQSFLIVDGQHACLRCLQPDLSRPGRFDPLRGPVPEPVLGCGDRPVTPYGPAAPMAAASLAASHAADWGLGRPRHLLRTVRLDWDRTVKRDPKYPERVPQCPACGKA